MLELLFTPRFMTRPYLLPIAFALAIALTACSHSNQGQSSESTPPPTPQQAKAAAQARATDREQLDEIPPPAKSRYMAIRTRENWGNPFLIVGKKTVNLRIMYPEPPKSSIAPGNLMQPANARKRELDLRLSDLPEALAALPQEAWPYGRVIAVEEDPAAPHADRIQVRRNVEATIQMLNDLGVVVYEWAGATALR